MKINLIRWTTEILKKVGGYRERMISSKCWEEIVVRLGS